MALVEKHQPDAIEVCSGRAADAVWRIRQPFRCVLSPLGTGRRLGSDARFPTTMWRNMYKLVPLILLLFAPIAGVACLHELNAGAGSEFGVDEEDETSLDTPPIELEDGGTTDDSCEVNTAQAMEILGKSCVACHGTPGAPTAGFDFVTNVETLKSRRVMNPAYFDPRDGLLFRFLTPGEPEHSYIFVRMMTATMPPKSGVDPRLDVTYPTISDMSVIYTWIKGCTGEDDNPPPGG